MSHFKKYKNCGIDEKYPPPPSPPCISVSVPIEKWELEMAEWREGFKEWQHRREENIVKSRFEVLDL